MLIASLVLHQVKEVGTVMQKEINSECRTLAYISLVLTILGLAMVPILHYRKSKLSKGHMFSNTVKIMIFISDVQNYIPIKLCKTAGSIQPVPTTTIQTAPTLTVTTASTQMPVVRSTAASIPVTVYKLATGQFADVLNPTGRPQDKRNSSIHSKPPPLEDIPNAPVRQGTPWANSGSAPENLFMVRKDWPIPPTPVPTPAPSMKTEAPPLVAVIPCVMVMPKQVTEKCSWGLHCPICKNMEEHEEDWDDDKQREQPRMHPQKHSTASLKAHNNPSHRTLSAPSHGTIRTPSHSITWQILWADSIQERMGRKNWIY